MDKLTIGLLASSFYLLCSCGSDKKTDEIHFATLGEYPPFEYLVRGNLQGFDVDLANMLSQKPGKKAVFENMHSAACFLP